MNARGMNARELSLLALGFLFGMLMIFAMWEYSQDAKDGNISINDYKEILKSCERQRDQAWRIYDFCEQRHETLIGIIQTCVLMDFKEVRE